MIGAVRQGKELSKTAKMVGNAARMAQKAYVTVESESTALDLAGDAKIEYAVNGGEMTASIVAKEFGAIALAGIAAASGKSLIKDASSLARLADIRFKTTRLEMSDAASGKKIQYGGVGDCFVAGTRVKTAEGDRNIEEVEEGDYVLAENPETGEQGYRKVAGIFIREKYTIIHVFVCSEEIETTEEHPFYVEGVGFVPAGELNAGDIIRTADGRNLPVTKVEREELEEPVLVYNFEVEDFHTYYVSELGVLVHNTCLVTGDVKGSSKTVNIDTGTANAFISQDSAIRHELKDYVKGKNMVMTETAVKEFKNIVNGAGGALEQARAKRFLSRVTIIPDNPSNRIMNLQITKKVGANDKIIFGTGDNLNIVTMTSDAKFVRGASAQGVDLNVYIHSPMPLTGR